MSAVAMAGPPGPLVEGGVDARFQASPYLDSAKNVSTKKLKTKIKNNKSRGVPTHQRSPKIAAGTPGRTWQADQAAMSQAVQKAAREIRLVDLSELSTLEYVRGGNIKYALSNKDIDRYISSCVSKDFYIDAIAFYLAREKAPDACARLEKAVAERTRKEGDFVLLPAHWSFHW